MYKKELKEKIKEFGDEWYYYYNFDGIEVRKETKRSYKHKIYGIHNFKTKIKPVLEYVIEKLGKVRPSVFDIGCNMGLYDHEMTKMGMDVVAIDQRIDIAQFFSRYVEENLNEDWAVDLKKMDMKKETEYYNDRINIITMFCVIYHLHPYENDIVNRFKTMFPNHKYIVLQGNKSRVIKRKQPLAGVKGMKKFLKKHGYDVKVFSFDGYHKPIVLGIRK